MGWGKFKPLLADAVAQPIQARYNELMADRGELDRVLYEGRDRANAVAEATVERVRSSLGFLQTL